MQTNRIRLGQLIAFCGGIVLLASLSRPWFRTTHAASGAPDALQTAWEALSWADAALAVTALAALVITLAVAVADRGDAPRLLLFLLGAVATVIVVAYGVAPAILGGPGTPQSAVWVALAASISLLAGADGIQVSFGSGTRAHDPEAWLAQGMYYGDLGGSAAECGGSDGDLGGFSGDPGGFGGDCSV